MINYEQLMKDLTEDIELLEDLGESSLLPFRSLTALQKLIAERDALASELEKLKEEINNLCMNNAAHIWLYQNTI